MFAIARALFIQTKNRLGNVRNNDICAEITIYNAPSNMNSKTPFK